MSTQIPSLDKGDMTAAERANLQLTEQTIVLMVKFLRDYAARYPLNLRKQLSESNNSETKVDINFGTEKLFSATLGTDNKFKKIEINQIADFQAQCIQEALSKQKGETLDTRAIRDMYVKVNGISLFEMTDGKVIQNDLPPEFCKAIGATIAPKPLQLSLNTTPNSVSDASPPESSTTTNPIRGVATSDLNKTSRAGQEQLNRDLIAEAKRFLDRLFPNQPVGDRHWNHDKYTITEKGSALSVYSAETNTTVRQENEAITGNARQKDVSALKQVNAAIDQNLSKSATKSIEVEVES